MATGKVKKGMKRGKRLLSAFGRKVKSGTDQVANRISDVAEEAVTQLNRLVDEVQSGLNDLRHLGEQEIARVKRNVESVKEYANTVSQHRQTDKEIQKELKKFHEMSALLALPIRREHVRNALNSYMENAGADAAKPFAKKYKSLDVDKVLEKASKAVEDGKDPKGVKECCDKCWELEQEILREDLLARELNDPGSTWQVQMDFAVQDAVPPGLLDKGKQRVGQLLKKVTGTGQQAVSEKEFAALMTSFFNAHQKKIDQMKESVPRDKQQEFADLATEELNDICNTVFARQNHLEDRFELGKLMMEANSQALEQLTVLKRRPEYRADATPQVSVHNGKLLLIKSAPPIESLVLQGGGGKGIGYPPVFEQLEKTGTLKDVNLLIGTSIGALNAACMACGGSNKDQETILEVKGVKQIKNIAYGAKDFSRQYPGVSFGDKHLERILPTMGGQMAKMDRLTVESVRTNLGEDGFDDTTLVNDLMVKLESLDTETLERLGLKGADDGEIEQRVKQLAAKLKDQDFDGDRMSQMITFRDLAILHQLDPAKFKELTITGWEGTGSDGKMAYFNSRTTPDMPIAIAARISMGLPFFSPIFWNGRGPFYDGGFGSNTPLEAAPGLDELYDGRNPGDVGSDLVDQDVPPEVQEAMAKTMYMTFDNEGTATENLFGQGRRSGYSGLGEDALVSMMNPNYDRANTDDANKAYNSGVNTMQVFHGTAGTMSFGPLEGDEESQQYARNLAKMRALEHISFRMDQAVGLTCANTDEALRTLSDAEKKRIVDAGVPADGDELVIELFEKCRDYLDLADKAGDPLEFVDALVDTPLTESHRQTIGAIHEACDNVTSSKDMSKEALSRIEVSTAASITSLPAYLQPLVRRAVLLPIQQRLRKL